MKRKAEFSSVLGFLVAAMMIMTTVYFIQLWYGYGKSEVQGVYSNYFVTYLDRDVSTVVSAFEKTALFHGLRETAKHLGEHGGVPEEINDSKSVIEPDLNFYNGVYSWTFIRNCNLETRIPFTIYRNKNILLGDLNLPLENPNNVALKTAIINIWMFKKGPVTVSCIPDGCTIDGKTKIEETGTYVYSIDGATHLVLNADENTAILTFVGASPYEGSTNTGIFINSLNKFLTGRLQEAQENARFSSTLTATPIDAVFGRDDMFPTGFSRFEEGISGKIESPDLPAVTVWSFGNTNETLKVRYWNLYDYAQQFTLTAPDILTYRLWNVLESFSDYQNREDSKRCWGMPTLSNGRCPKDNIDYEPEDFLNEIKNDVEDFENKYNDAITDPGISLDLEVPSSLFTGCDINTNSRDVDSCTSENFEYYEYLDGTIRNVHNCSPGPCGSCYTVNACRTHWHHRYILKKLRIQATFTDSTHKTMTETGDWIPETFTFMIELPIIDDNCCNGYYCDSKRSTACDTTKNDNGNPFDRPPDYAEMGIMPLEGDDTTEYVYVEPPEHPDNPEDTSYEIYGVPHCNLYYATETMEDYCEEEGAPDPCIVLNYNPSTIGVGEKKCVTINEEEPTTQLFYCYKTDEIEKTLYLKDCGDFDQICNKTTGACEDPPEEEPPEEPEE